MSSLDASEGAAVAPRPAPLQPALPIVGAATSTATRVPAKSDRGNAALVRARDSATRLASRVQYHIARVGPAGQTGIAALTAAAVLAVATLIPAHHAIEALRADLARVQRPSHNAVTPEQGAQHFVRSLPTRDQMPAVVGQIFEQAQQAGVPLPTGHYSYSAAKTAGVGRYEIEFPVKAAYPNIRDFINGTLSAVPSAGLDKLLLERKAVGESIVSADIRFVVFVRGE